MKWSAKRSAIPVLQCGHFISRIVLVILRGDNDFYSLQFLEFLSLRQFRCSKKAEHSAGEGGDFHFEGLLRPSVTWKSLPRAKRTRLSALRDTLEDAPVVSQGSPDAHKPADKLEEKESAECDFFQWRDEQRDVVKVGGYFRYPGLFARHGERLSQLTSLFNR